LNAPSVPRRRRDDGLRFGKSPLEIRAFARADVEVRHFEDHVDIASADAERAHCCRGGRTVTFLRAGLLYLQRDSRYKKVHAEII